MALSAAGAASGALVAEAVADGAGAAGWVVWAAGDESPPAQATAKARIRISRPIRLARIGAFRDLMFSPPPQKLLHFAKAS
jgi:hypothetical protein